MRSRFELTIAAKCPVDGSPDSYETVVVRDADTVLQVEDLLGYVAHLVAYGPPVFQEELTSRLAARFNALVTTVGDHSGVRLTCRVDARRPCP